MFDSELQTISKAYDGIRMPKVGRFDDEAVYGHDKDDSRFDRFRKCDSIDIRRSSHGYAAVNSDEDSVGLLDFHICYGDEAIDELSDTVGYDSSFKAIEPLSKCVYVEELLVEKPYRRNGVARKMLERMVSEYDHCQMVLRAFDDRGESSPRQLAVMYKKFGFCEILDTGDDGIVMIRKANV